MNDINGILIIDKPEGMSSAKVVGRLKRLLRVRKIGHAGTLDPFATGVLVCCVNQATKLARFLIHDHKVYRAGLRLGIDTDTQDYTGQIINQTENISVSQHAIDETLKQFSGEIQQVPPIYSALKHQGVPLYRLARQGKPVQKPARTIRITSITFLKMDLPDLTLEVACSAGTYIRTLCADIGKQLGCGGHLQSLRRLQSGSFKLGQAITLAEIERLARDQQTDSCFITMNQALAHMPFAIADGKTAQKITYGQLLTDTEIRIDQPVSDTPFIKVINQEGDLLAILEKKEAMGDYVYCNTFC